MPPPARLWADAFAADPRQAENEKARHRYNAACAAALAGCGLDKDDPAPDDAAKEKLRRQALDWLRADLAAYSRLLAGTGPQSPALVRQRLQHWQQDTDFRGVRGDGALAKLPEAEREGWRTLWADVAATLAQARGKTAPEQGPGVK
jgi:serine/threonine-protein kinase